MFLGDYIIRNGDFVDNYLEEQKKYNNKQTIAGILKS